MVTCLVWVFTYSERHHDNFSAPISAPEEYSGPPRIAIVTFITSERSFIHTSLKNKDFYARRHGYDLIVDYESQATRGTTWLKFDMVKRLVDAGKHDWIWWVDFDTLITNTTVRLEDIIYESLANVTAPEEIDLLLTDDCNGLNDGSFIVRSSKRSIAFLVGVSALHDTNLLEGKNNLNDQEAMRDYLALKGPLTKHALMIPQNKINAFPEEIGCYDAEQKKWEKGMFVIHFAGAWAHVKDKDATGLLMRKYESEIIWDRK
ncbi:galactosyl transferase GMA12/MNN10 family-domain-containing protein [Clohesyomyces aquaticus]|uniref:Galactosyl transferase GMA12/MNN10 family-domain-containing protein n=1 Tax=Clohesyomyces aquaticus TaxID=1231657 RepID=A0A1Y1ZHT2_9PLEO|nr:galactosyl transferase GMA12/MNN10 family-domain-containing protein [Clohesyomyces aquaticus]